MTWLEKQMGREWRNTVLLLMIPGFHLEAKALLNA
jgi:hypothetical protein